MAQTMNWKDDGEDVLYCPECDEVREEDEQAPAYECGDCGVQFTRDETDDGSNRCPECNKFAGEIADKCCTDCYAELEVVKAVNADGIWVVLK